MPSKKICVLVVDDNVHMLRLMQRILELEGYRVVTAQNGEDGLEVFHQEHPDLVLLDIMLPGMDGYTVCQRIREFSQVPVIMVTVKSNEEEKVQGLDAGADDYVAKPFSPKELAARVRTVLRRAQHWDEPPEPAFRYNELVIDFARHKVTLGGDEVNLIPTEYRLLCYLARNAGRVVTPDEILERVWGKEYCGEIYFLQVNMSWLRKKLKDDPQVPGYILSRPGIGYTMPKSYICTGQQLP